LFCFETGSRSPDPPPPQYCGAHLHPNPQPCPPAADAPEPSGKWSPSARTSDLARSPPTAQMRVQTEPRARAFCVPALRGCGRRPGPLRPLLAGTETGAGVRERSNTRPQVRAALTSGRIPTLAFRFRPGERAGPPQVLHPRRSSGVSVQSTSCSGGCC
jgi:hypothetical protein